MSRLRFTKVAQPSTPAANKSEIYVDTADRRLKQIDDLGTVNVLTPDGTDCGNYLYNGGCDVNQRITAALTTLSATNGGAPSATARVATIDRWMMTCQTISAPQAQWVDTIAAPETGITARYYVRFKQITGAGKQMISQTLTGTDTAKLRGKVVRLQAKLRLSVGSNKILKMGLVQNNSAATVDSLAASFVPTWNGNGSDPTLGTNLAYVAPSASGLDNCTVVGNGLSCNVTSTWQRFSGLFTVPADCRNISAVIWTDSQMTINDDNLMTEIGLYLGTEIMDWNPRTQTAELLECQRFFYKSFPQATVPATNGGVNGCHVGIIGKAAATALAGQIGARYPVTLYKVPATPVFYSPSSAANHAYRITGTSPAVQTATAVIQSTDNGCVIQCTGDANGAVGDLVGVHVTADAEI